MTAYDAWDREYQENKDAYLKIFDDFMSQMNYENNEEWERSFAEHMNRKHCVSVASATDALHFALLAHGIGLGDEVLVTDFSWISSASCVDMVGATPVFCDIDILSYQMNFESIKRMASDKTKALIYTHLYGNMVDTTEIEQWCESKGIRFIEDSAQSLGTSFNGRKAGTIGYASSYSFNANKVVSGLCGGGVLMTDDDTLGNYARKVRRHGNWYRVSASE